jgi:hypothetical protein
MHLTIRENSKLLRLSESLRRTARSIYATGRKDLATEIDGAAICILRALKHPAGANQIHRIPETL